MLLAARMQNENRVKIATLGVVAELVKDYTFIRYDGMEVTLCEGTQVYVDEVNGIASVNDDIHINVEPCDYRICFPN